MSKMNQNVVVPEGSMLLNTEEMRAVEGGLKIYVNDEKCMAIASVLALGGPQIIAAMSIPAVASAITAASGAIAASLSAIPGLNVTVDVIALWLMGHSLDFAGALVGAAKNRRGMDIKIGLTGGIIPSIDCVARKKK